MESHSQNHGIPRQQVDLLALSHSIKGLSLGKRTPAGPRQQRVEVQFQKTQATVLGHMHGETSLLVDRSSLKKAFHRTPLIAII